MATLKDTPVTTKQSSSSSLVRHLFEVRRKQMEQQRMLEESSITASPALAKGTNSVYQGQTRNISACTESAILQRQLLFSASTPASDDGSSQRSPDTASTVIASTLETAARVPLSPLQLENVAASHTKPKIDLGRYGENSPPRSKGTLSGVESSPPKQYNPNLYRSPPKIKTTIAQTHSQKESNPSVRPKNFPKFSVPKILSNSHTPDIDRPISVSHRSFEDLVIEKIKAGAYHSASPRMSAPKKFLRKGTGLNRYESRSEPNCSHEAGNEICERESICSSTDEPQLKFPYLRKGVGKRRFNLKSVKCKKHPSERADQECGTPIDRLILAHSAAQNYSTPLNQIASTISSRKLKFTTDQDGKSLSPIVKKYPRREVEELKAFEKLEELAENTSFSSNASTVHSLLQKGLDCSETSTVLNSPVFQEKETRPSESLRRIFSDRVALAARKKKIIQENNVPASNIRTITDSAGMTPDPRRNYSSEDHSNKRQRTVQFDERGAHVMEYFVNNDDTVSEAPTMSEASEMINVSDLEALNELYQMGRLKGLPVTAEFLEKPLVINVPTTAVLAADNFRSQEESCLDSDDDVPAQPQRTVLRFSPPRMPPNAASYAVWEAFGKRPAAAPSVLINKQNNSLQLKPGPSISNTVIRKSDDVTPSNKVESTIVPAEHSDQIKRLQEELASHKVLLVSKVHELETEINSFQTEKSQLSKLKDIVQREKDQLAKEKKMFESAITEDRKRMEAYFEAETNKIWKEKCTLESKKSSVIETTDTLEMINLREEILLLKKELEKRDSMHMFTQNKLKDRIKELNRQNKEFEQKIYKYSNIEKENLALKHQVDRLKIVNKVGALPSAKRNAEPVIQTRTSLLRKAVRFSESQSGDGASNIVKSLKQRGNGSTDFEANGTVLGESSKNYFDSDAFTLPGSCPRNSSLSTTGVSEAASGSPSLLGSSLNSSEVTLVDGSRLITYTNGNKKQIFPTGAVIQEYYNGDRKEVYPDKVVYYYSKTETTQTSYENGIEEFNFADGQKEIKRPDGSIEIIFPDLSRKRTDLDGSEMYHKADGTTITTTATGEKVFMFPSGQREVHGAGFKRREYPNGTVKEVRDDGSVHTTYADGRVRVKDSAGNVLSDSKLGIDYIATR